MRIAVDCQNVLIDDTPEVCQGVREAGLLAIEYSTKWEK